jgi:hypothetical protein
MRIGRSRPKREDHRYADRSMPDVELIPPEGEREWVLDALRALVQTCGHEHLVSAPVVLPEARCFPDAWTPDADGVRRLALRILGYAALDELDVEVELFDEGHAAAARPDALVRTQAHEGAAAWFSGIVDRTCRFGADVSLLDDPGGVTAALAHETAHAFRHVQGLVVEDRDLEECLTDLSTIYLGLGVLTANASLRHRSWSFADGGSSLGGHAWSTSQLGYLSPQAMCFALAAFERVRARGTAERRTIVAALETNQAGYFKAALRWLDREFHDHAALRGRLGIPDPSEWPQPQRLEDLLAGVAVGSDTATASPPAAAPRPDRDWNTGNAVYRVPLAPNPLLGLVLVLAGAIGSVPLFDAGLEPLAIAAIAAGVVAARLIPRRFPRHECSTCNGLLLRGRERCALCGGTVAGTLARAEDRLELPDP